MPRDASELARRLARDAEAVCRHYLSKGRRQGRYWTVGDVRNTPGRSMFVRLSGPEFGPGEPGIGPMPPRLNTAICSTSSARAAGSLTFAMSPRRRGASSRCPAPNRRMSQDCPFRPVRPKPRGASGRCRSQSRAPWAKRTYVLAGSRTCGVARRSAFTPAVGIVAARTTLAIGVGTLGPPSLRRSQRMTARSPARIALGLRLTGWARRPLTRRGGQWAISSATLSGSAARFTS
jgi:hypothetical protein